MDNQLILKKCRVINFRSILDSGWVDLIEITALIGMNEAGKTNYLLPLWKFNPAKPEEGKIDLQVDCPRSLYNRIRTMKASERPKFIEVEFEISQNLREKLSECTGYDVSYFQTVIISRTYGGDYSVDFQEWRGVSGIAIEKLLDPLKDALADFKKIDPKNNWDRTNKEISIEKFSEAIKMAESAEGKLDSGLVKKIIDSLQITIEDSPKSSKVAPVLVEIKESTFDPLTRLISNPADELVQEATDEILENLPAFVYYSNYGNLDSEIYLPHVIDNLKRSDLGLKESAKARTLKMLFEFVNLSPQEILDLGSSVDNETETEIEKTARNTKERDILLQGASAKLTKKFKSWWQQGEYTFRLQADGNHFRIWVSDEKRPEEIELEGRSTGLQWFLSFFLTFLVEKKDSHHGCILLLDEPGHSLHALAQKDLSRFFEQLGLDNQILYTTHSPFLVDPDKLERVRVVYIDGDGHSKISANLREGVPQKLLDQSIYPVYAALGLSYAEIHLSGAQPVVVEGPSDQYYFSLMKMVLISQGMICPDRELLFFAAGGVKGVKPMVHILSGQSGNLPVVFVDGDSAGKNIENHLKTNIYADHPKKLLSASHFTKKEKVEIEDLFPISILQAEVAKLFRGPEESFEEVALDESRPFVEQVCSYMKEYGISDDGWKVKLSEKFKIRVLKNPSILTENKECMDVWRNIFDSMISSS